MKLKSVFSRCAVVLVAAAVSASSFAQASDSSGNAFVNVLASLTISRNSDTNWGSVIAPPSGSANYLLDYSTGSVSVTSGSGYAYNNGSYGSYTVAGAPNASVSYSVSAGSFDGSGVSFNYLTINGNNGSGSGNLDGSGQLELRIGGEVYVDSSATVMNHTAQLTVSVNYN